MTDEQLCKAYRDAVDIKMDKLRVEIKANKDLFDAQVRGNEKALELARDILNARMEIENGIRNELREQTATFVPRREFYTVMTLLTTMMAVALTFLIFIK